MIEVSHIQVQGGGRWELTAGIRDTERISMLTGSRAKRRTDPGQAVWRVPATVEAAKQILNTLPDASWSAEAKKIRTDLARTRRARIHAARGQGSHLFEDERLSGPQNVGLDWLMCGSGVLADDMGSGKTVMASLAAHYGGYQKILVLTTKSTLSVWADHLTEWSDQGITPFVFHGTKTQQEKAWSAFEGHQGPKALVSTHALAGTHSRQASFGNISAEGEGGRFNEEYDLCIIDEAHKMGVNPRNKWVRSMWAIGTNCQVRWALTGTPVNDVPDDLWVLFRFTNPDVLGRTRGGFRNRYCIMKPQFHGGMENEGLHPDTEDEFQWTVRPYLLRRLKREVVEGLPDAMPIQYVRLPMTAKQAKAYRAMVKNMMVNIGDGLLVSPDGLSQSQSCEYIADGTPVLDDDGRVASLEPTASGSNKLEYILDVAEQRSGDPFVVYAFSRKTVEMLAEGLSDKGYRVGQITGRTSQNDRDTYVGLFQKGHLDVILLTDAGAEGITLTAADLVIFARESWRAPTNQQVRDRTDRWGQTRPPHTVVLMSEGTVDETRRLVVSGKVAMQEEVLQDEKKIKAFLGGDPNTEETF